MKNATFGEVKPGQIFESPYGKCLKVYEGIYIDRDYWMIAEDKAPVSAMVLEGENAGRPIGCEDNDEVTLYEDMTVNFS